MALYNFTLTLSGVTSRTVGLEDALHAAGCADALVCFYGTLDHRMSTFDIALSHLGTG